MLIGCEMLTTSMCIHSTCCRHSLVHICWTHTHYKNTDWFVGGQFDPLVIMEMVGGCILALGQKGQIGMQLITGQVGPRTNSGRKGQIIGRTKKSLD